MDLASVIGIVVACALIIGSILIGSAPLTAFIDVPSILVVIGGSVAAGFICFPMGSMLGSPKVMLKTIFNKSENKLKLIEQIVALAETARRDGLLALEWKIAEIENPLVKTGIQMAVDGNSPEVVEQVLRTEADALSARHKEGKAIMDQMGRFAPAYGMIGTLLGLIMMLADMSDPSKLGAGMAVALITTLYGAIMANVFFCPFAEKLGLLSRAELTSIEIAVRGVMAIQSGESPRAIRQKLRTFLPPNQRNGEFTRTKWTKISFVRKDPGNECEPGPVMIPEWIVTFGDMMSLLLTFFIMLASMSEIKRPDQYEAVVESMREQFGYTKSLIV